MDTWISPLFLSCVIRAALWGAGTLQAYWYYVTSTRDRIWLKTLVAAVWLSDTAQQALLTQAIYYYAIQSYFDVSSLDRFIPTIVIITLFEAITTFLVHGFFVWRIYTLSSRNTYVSTATSLFVIAKLGLGIATVVRGMHAHTWSLAFALLHRLYWISHAAIAFIDVMICTLLCWYLVKSKTNSPKFEGLVHRLIFYSVITGALTALCALLTLLLSVIPSKMNIAAVLYFLTSNLYVNSFFASLNARRSLREELEVEMQMDVPRTLAIEPHDPIGSALHFRSQTTEYAQREGRDQNDCPGDPELASEILLTSNSTAKRSLDIFDIRNRA